MSHPPGVEREVILVRLLRHHRTMVDEERDAAGAELRAVLPAGWIVMGPVWRKDDRGWAVYARQLPGPGQDPDAWREASGRTEARALRAMAQQFRVGPAV